jgi:hypothetical protein
VAAFRFIRRDGEAKRLQGRFVVIFLPQLPPSCSPRLDVLWFSSSFMGLRQSARFFDGVAVAADLPRSVCFSELVCFSYFLL